jgi:hypothetical protein
MIDLASPATLESISKQLPHAPIAQLADVVRRNWANPSPYALPYLRAMFSLKDMDSMYGADDAQSIILYFLSNAASYRGPVARLVKAELKSRCGVK